MKSLSDNPSFNYCMGYTAGVAATAFTDHDLFWWGITAVIGVVFVFCLAGFSIDLWRERHP